jgi:hypothetical protein
VLARVIARSILGNVTLDLPSARDNDLVDAKLRVVLGHYVPWSYAWIEAKAWKPSERRQIFISPAATSKVMLSLSSRYAPLVSMLCEFISPSCQYRRLWTASSEWTRPSEAHARRQIWR